MTEGEARGRLSEVLRARRETLERLRARGVEPFALSFEPDALAGDLHQRFGAIGVGQGTGERVSVAGRIVLERRHGKLSFLVIRDRSGDIQLFCQEEALGPDGYAFLDDLDLGDIVGGEGEVVKTRRGELSVKVDRLVLLTKALRPLPEKWHGLRDPELRARRRYLQLATDLDARRLVHDRATVLRTLRTTLEGDGFVEVETPVLHPTPGGALARPFVAHHNVLDVDLYLRIALELYLKRLLVAGIERVYEIGRNFRNEGIDRDHNPEFTMLEFYQAYGTYEDMMRLSERLVRACAVAVRGGLRFEHLGRPVDLESPWRTVTVLEAVSGVVGEELSLDDPDRLRAMADRHGVGFHPGWGPGKVLLELFEKLVERDIWDPTFVKDFPREVSPLARPHRDDPRFTEHFDLVVCGMEIGPAYSELTDPDEQRARFEEQRRQRAETGDEEAHPFDEDFLLALEHGMPPAGGMGIGIDRLLMILSDVPSIRDVISFPHLRPED